MKKTVLVTGANGFIGNALCNKMQSQGWLVRAALRSHNNFYHSIHNIDYRYVDDIGPETDWATALEDVDTIVHLASRVHVMNDHSLKPIDEYRRVNVYGTERLARMAAAQGVRRFVFISSCKVNGEGRLLPYTEQEEPMPEDSYGISKFEAEKTLHVISKETGLEVVIIRPPLVYGPGVKANFLQLMKLVRSGLPIPLASVMNRRSLIYIGNLLDAICLCVVHPNAKGQIYFVSDAQVVSTAELIRNIAIALDVKVRLFYFNLHLLKLAFKLIGKSQAADKLIGTHVVDSSKIKLQLGWQPPYTIDEGIAETVKFFNKYSKL